MKIYLAIFSSIVLLSSCAQHVFYGSRRHAELTKMSRFILQDLERVALEFPDTIIRVNQDLRFREYLEKKSWRTGIVYRQAAIRMKWFCVLDDLPDTTIVLPFPELPVQMQSKFVVNGLIDRERTVHLPTIYYSPVFETKEPGVYAFHRTMDYNLGAEWDFMEVTHRIFIRFRIDDAGAVVWLDCCGSSFYPFE